MKHEVRAIQGNGGGSIINISSTYGHEGAAGASIYVGSKHAVEGITQIGGARDRQVGGIGVEMPWRLVLRTPAC